MRSRAAAAVLWVGIFSGASIGTAWGQQQPLPPAQQPPAPRAGAVPAESLMGDYSARVAMQVLMIGALVVLVLGGGILIVNLGMLSKRPEDHTGHRTPSEPAFFKDEIQPFPEDRSETRDDRAA